MTSLDRKYTNCIGIGTVRSVDIHHKPDMQWGWGVDGVHIIIST